MAPPERLDDEELTGVGAGIGTGVFELLAGPPDELLVPGVAL